MTPVGDNCLLFGRAIYGTVSLSQDFLARAILPVQCWLDYQVGIFLDTTRAVSGILTSTVRPSGVSISSS
jgi:hypothetical protein